MGKNKFVHSLGLRVLLSLALPLAGCHQPGINSAPAVGGSPSLVTKSGRTDQLVVVSSLAILPIRYEQKVRLLGEDVRASAERELAAAFEREVDFKIIAPGDVVKALGAPSDIDPAALGRQLKVDGVLITTVHQYIERSGSSLGAERPATVDFSMRVVRSGTGTEVWRATYHYNDEPITENLFNIGARLSAGSVGRFHSAQEILADGFGAAGRELAELRAGTFRR